MAKLPSKTPYENSLESNPSSGWFYEIEDQTYGPVSFSDLREKALELVLLGHHKVWKQGSNTKVLASSIVGLIAQNHPKKALPSSSRSADCAQSRPTHSITDGPPGGLYLPHLKHSSFLSFLGILLATVGLGFYAVKIHHPILKITLFSLAGMGLITWVALSMVYLHRSWEMMHMLGGRFTGNQALRHLVIPFFNAFWCIVVLFGWAKLWNDNVKTHPGLSLAKRVWRPSFFLFPISLLAAEILTVILWVQRKWPSTFPEPLYQISLQVFGTCLLLWLVCWFQLCRSINFLAKKKI